MLPAQEQFLSGRSAEVFAPPFIAAQRCDGKACACMSHDEEAHQAMRGGAAAAILFVLVVGLLSTNWSSCTISRQVSQRVTTSGQNAGLVLKQAPAGAGEE